MKGSTAPQVKANKIKINVLPGAKPAWINYLFCGEVFCSYREQTSNHMQGLVFSLMVGGPQGGAVDW